MVLTSIVDERVPKHTKIAYRDSVLVFIIKKRKAKIKIS